MVLLNSNQFFYILPFIQTQSIANCIYFCAPHSPALIIIIWLFQCFFFMYVNAALATYKIVPHIKWSRSSFMILDKNTHPHLNNKKKFKWLYFCVCVKEILENYIISRKTPHKPQ